MLSDSGGGEVGNLRGRRVRVDGRHGVDDRHGCHVDNTAESLQALRIHLPVSTWCAV